LDTVLDERGSDSGQMACCPLDAQVATTTEPPMSDGQVLRLRPRPQNRQTHQALGEPFGVAMQFHFREDGIVWQQPIEHAGQMFLVALGPSLLCLVYPSTLRAPS
jgi:hypothetical protein